ncbi:hypothetical protein DFH11DRAFT_1561828 [Phellopilus nigrolimitatus]|nr:hypothetical protein DFH11DRAFT_1561828 [Phellopilus nigrolimitatus]
MPPIQSTESLSTSSISFCSVSCTPQVVLGCVLPFLIVAFSIPVMIIKRHLDYKLSTRCTRPQAVTPRVLATPRLPLTSVYVARVDYFLPAIDTTVTLPNHSSPFAKSLGLAKKVVPMVSLPSLPSLSSVLCEFVAYADVIEPESLGEARSSSTCLLESVFSSMDVNALSISSLPLLVQPQNQDLAVILPDPLSPKEPSMIHSDSDDAEVSDSIGEHVGGTNETEGNNATLDITAAKLYSITEEQDDNIDYFGSMDIDSLSLSNTSADDIVEEISTSQLIQTTSHWSLFIDSFSTLGSMLAVRLGEFPPVPTFLPSRMAIGQDVLAIVHRQSESSIQLSLSRSVSAPASLNILEMRLEDFLLQGKSSRPCLLKWPSFSDPGELWDEEDDLLFSEYVPQNPIDLSRKCRHTWTAGVDYERVEKGELWDAEDDRRISSMGEFEALSTLVSLSAISLAMENDRSMGLSSLVSGEDNSLERDSCRDAALSFGVQEQDGSHAECDCFDDSGFAEEASFNDSETVSAGDSEREVDLVWYNEEFTQTPNFWSLPSSSLQLSAFENLAIKSRPCSSGSTRSSLMSLASLLDIDIQIVDPIHAPEDLAAKTFVAVDMELEPDHSYSSHIFAVYHPLIRQGCAY